MGKSRRKQARNKRRQETAKKHRKQRAHLAKLKADVQPHLEEANRLMKEAENLMHQAITERKRAQEDQPGFKLSPALAMRLLYRGLQSDGEFKSAFCSPPRDWKSPMIKSTRYELANRQFGERIWGGLQHNPDVYIATQKPYHQLIGDHTDRALCSECAKYDWRHHLTAFDGIRVDWANIDPAMYTADPILEIISKLGGKFKLERDSTSFKLPGLAHSIDHHQECTLCSLFVSAVKAVSTPDQFDHIASDAQAVEITCYSPFKNSLGDRWILYARFCSDEHTSPIGSWDVVVLRFVLHCPPSYSSMPSPTWDPFIKEALREAGRDLVPPTQIDPGPIPSWWRICNENHLGCRRQVEAGSTRHPKSRPTGKLSNLLLRVIDVEKDEIVIAPKACQYTALSYVWGGIDGYLSKKCKRTHDLLTGNEIIRFKRKRVPRTIRDAMQVTKMIGQRDLWVDALCIVQDDDQERGEAIAAMNDIYRNALPTIVAADGKNADASLIGLHPGSSHIQSVVGSVDSIHLTLEEPAPELAQSIWSSRAWTYQEEQFSRRLLVFAHERVYYKCKEGSFGEARPHQQLKDSILSTDLDPKLMNIYDDADQVLYVYTEHVRCYTSLQLTYESDILHGFEGILSHLSSRTTSGSHYYMFLWGLPLPDLIYALAWKPAASESSSELPSSSGIMPRRRLKRRTAQTRYWNGVVKILDNRRTNPRDNNAIENIDFPSWSWAGWVGQVHYHLFKYPKFSCWGQDKARSCFFSTTVDVPWKVQDEAAAKGLRTVWSEGILTFTVAEVATLEHDKVKEYEKHCADDDSCEYCRGQTQVHTRELRMDDGSLWEPGTTKEGILLLVAVGIIEDFQSHTVLLFRRDAVTGVCYREGIIELQTREWEAAADRHCEEIRLD